MGTTSFTNVKIIKADGTIGATNKATGSLTTTDSYYSFGGAADLWGEAWESTDINDVDFGIVVSFTGTGYPDGNFATHYLKATNFSFSIPAGATINGILAEIEASIGPGIAGVTLARVDHIRITIDYTEAAGGDIAKKQALIL